MKLRNPIPISLAVLVSLTGVSLAAGAEENAVVPGEVLIGFRAEQQNSRSIQSLSLWGHVAGSQPDIRTHRLKLNPGINMAAALVGLRSRPDIAFAEPNHILHVAAAPNDAYYSYQWAPPRVKADLAWPLWTPKAQIIVAVVDTGVDGKHPDLVNQMLTDASGIIGYDAFQGNRDPAVDGFGHGTHCAGIIDAQANNATGIAGLASGGVKIMPVKVLDSTGAGTDATVADGILWAANHGARVISVSLGGANTSSTMNNACAYAWSKGCVIVAAAGNDGVSSKFYPAGCPNVLSVAATDSNDVMAGFSNWGNWISVAAPGDTILSTLPTYTVQPGWPLNYGYMSGTSMAAPHVSAEAAMLLAQNPGLTNAQVVSIITSNVDPYAPISGHTLGPGVGRINLYKALLAAGASAPVAPSVPNAPTHLNASASSGSVRLSWDASPGASGYNIKRALRSGGAYTLLAANLKAISFTDNGLANGTAYYYVVSAVNAGGESANSTEAMVITPAPPAAPNGLTAKTSNGIVQLAWNLRSSANVVQINIYRSNKNGTGFVLLKSVGKLTAYTDLQPMRGVNNYYTLKAINSAGQESAYSNQATVAVGK